MKKLAIVVSHPIQYYTPLFVLLAKAKGVDIKVFYTWDTPITKYDPGFGKNVAWDIPLLEGYQYEFLKNSARNPGSHHFMGIQNPDALERIHKFDPDVILVYGWAYHSHLKIIRHFSGKIPVWFRGDSTLLDRNSGLKTWLRSALLKWIYRHVNRAFYVGSANKSYFVKYSLNSNQLSFLPHAVDNNRFGEFRGDEVNMLRDKLKIGADDLVVLFAGKFDPIKNPSVLLNAFLQQDQRNIHLIFAGSGGLENNLKQDSRGHSNVHFCGFINQSDMPVYYQVCDLFCLPSFSETWGLAVNEAMAAGKAVLVSNRAGCAQDLVSENENGLLCNPDDIGDVSKKLRYLLSDRRRLQIMGEKSLELIQNYSFEHQLEEIIKNLGKDV